MKLRNEKGKFIKTGQMKKCPSCNKEFYVKTCHFKLRKYCSMACKKNGQFKKCLVCNKEFYVKKSQLNDKKYCSAKCRRESTRNKPAWTNGLGYTTKKTYKSSRTTINGKTVLKSHLVWCSQPENLSYIPKGFVIHHIDCNAQNNSPDNLFLMEKGDHRRLHLELFKIRRVECHKIY
jgi:hypothetical protein